jgi:isoquinoline 1-oxidoreductase alpha subunit
MKLTINNQVHEVDAPENTPLLWVLREYLQLTGTKFGCGIAQCGACTVHIDGRAMRSCVYPVGQAVGKKITTIEGIPENHPVKKAWIEAQVPQCGYCQPGQIMQAIYLLQENANPDIEAIKAGMSGNLCRCGTYPRIIKAIQKVAKGDA